MTKSLLQPSPCETAPRTSAISKWTVEEHAIVTSTNLVAASLEAWHAVRADSQSAGRGRFQRQWVSDQGGLWLSAVVPVTAKSPAARILPLAAGVAVCDVVRGLGVEQIRMRWPNDVLAGSRKLAGLLIDQFVPGLVVVGIGINVSNRPEECDPALRGSVARLAEMVTPLPALDDLMRRVLVSLEAVCIQIETTGLETLLPRINALWEAPRKVQLDLDDEILTGQFEGIDAAGRLQLRLAGSEIRFYEPHQVRLLREIL